jgi:hypothetical protein
VAQLDAVERAGGANPARLAQYQNAIDRQRVEMNRTIEYSASIGCDFEPANAQCQSLQTNIERMQANLDKLEEINEIKNYLLTDVDPFLKPLIAYLLKNKPRKVHQAIKYWLESEGEEIKKQIEKE